MSESNALIIHSAPAGCGCLFGTYPAAASSAIGNASATIATSFGRSTASAAYLQVVGRGERGARRAGDGRAAAGGGWWRRRAGPLGGRRCNSS